MICLLLRFFLTLFFLILLLTLVRIPLGFLSGAAFRYPGFPFLIRLDLLFFTSAGWTAFRHYGFSFLFGLNLALLRLEPLPLFYSSPPAFWSGRFPYLFRLNLLNHGLSLTGSSRRSNSIDREGLWL